MNVVPRGKVVSSRMRCTTCDRHTNWHMTRWQAYEEWDEVMAC